ncbi:MAG: A/G-specific adenine glycosylase [Acidobacteriales bacterium]|nr:A/G-specific adenine glycosylase [Terriglobales bacterium]
MPSVFDVRRFRRDLLRWYRKHRRELPWRRTRDPYRIWVSEVMLQQTRVSVVLERYAQFLRRFPTLRKLARAKLAAVLAAWSGLGYYRRARALHHAARIVLRAHKGVLPQSSEQLRTLPGIGRYTAAAIASIAFGEPAALADGNVGRALARLYGHSAGDAWARAGQLLDPKSPGDFNQAMMELGATVCLPQQPLCARCPVRDFCTTRGKGNSPVKTARRKREASYGLLRKGGSIYLVQRSRDASLMADLWELPQLDDAPKQAPLLRLRHAITNTDYRVSVFAAQNPGDQERGRWVERKKVEQLPLTGLTRKILRRLPESDSLVRS